MDGSSLGISQNRTHPIIKELFLYFSLSGWSEFLLGDTFSASSLIGICGLLKKGKSTGSWEGGILGGTQDALEGGFRSSCGETVGRVG